MLCRTTKTLQYVFGYMYICKLQGVANVYKKCQQDALLLTNMGTMYNVIPYLKHASFKFEKGLMLWKTTSIQLYTFV